MKLLHLSLALSKDGFKWDQSEREAEEKDTAYLAAPLEGDMSRKRILKSDIMRPQRFFAELRLIDYSIWCLPEQENDARALLLLRVTTTAIKMKEEVDKLIIHLEKEIL